MSDFPPPPPVDPGVTGLAGKTHLTPAALGRRMGAGLIDGALELIPMVAFVWSVGNLFSALPNDSGETIGEPVGNVVVLFFVAMGMTVGLFVWIRAMWKQGTSPGKKMLGLYVVDIDTGVKVGVSRMFFREVVCKGLLGALLRGIPLVVGVVMILALPRRSALWDMIARTAVVHRD